MLKIVTRTTNIEYSIKMIAALVVGLLVTKAIGYPNVVTIPITAYLVCWSYRGIKGAISYFAFRLRIQLVFVIVDTLAWYGLTYLWPDSLPWHRFALLSCILVPIYLQLYYRFKIMPLDLTAVFSTLIILAGLMGTIDYGVRRIIWNICGLSIGCILTYLIPSATKLSKVRQSLLGLSRVWLDELDKLTTREKWVFGPSSVQYMADSIVEMASIQAYMTVVDKDTADTASFPLSLFHNAFFSSRYRSHADELQEIYSLLSAASALLALVRHVSTNSSKLACMDAEKQKYYFSCIQDICAKYRSALASGQRVSCPPVTFLVTPTSGEELLLLDVILKFALDVGKCSFSSGYVPIPMEDLDAC